MTDEGISMKQVQGEVNHDKKLSLATMNLILEVKDVEQLTRFLTRVDALPNVFDVHRVRPG
jgi:(p)ppGpp synthase/HD superfamily hydrolase